MLNETFNMELRLSPVLNPFASLLRWTIPIVELFVAILLLTKRGRINGLLATFFLMLIFTIYLIILNNFDYYIPCSCGGFLENISVKKHIFLNTILALTALLGFYQAKKIKIINN
jgi:hypothetical protein